jgi:hypothetical protein
MRHPYPLAGLLSLIAVGPIVLANVSAEDSAVVHERKEVAGLAVVFGAEPEPALTEEMQFLRWRVSSLADEKPYADFQDAEVTISRDGEEWGPFPVRGSRRTPGQYQTQHIFTSAGEYESVLSFRKGDEEPVHTVDFSFRIRDRASLEIPPRKQTGH